MLNTPFMLKGSALEKLGCSVLRKQLVSALSVPNLGGKPFLLLCFFKNVYRGQ
jgi:hypothetical protein